MGRDGKGEEERDEEMKPGFTMAEATNRVKQIQMRKDRIKHLNREMVRMQDCIRIMEDEIIEYSK